MLKIGRVLITVELPRTVVLTLKGTVGCGRLSSPKRHAELAAGVCTLYE